MNFEDFDKTKAAGILYMKRIPTAHLFLVFIPLRDTT